jgi:3D (Asp-Asp-Asp) domain-containing protein
MRTTTFLPLALVVLLSPAAHGGSTSWSSKAPVSRSLPPIATAAATPGEGHLARVTAYWPGEDYFTNRHRSSTGARLREGFCAVDPRIIPYGSMVQIPGVGNYLAMDTGTAVISRKAARESGHNREERSALVIDLYFASRRAGELFTREGPKFAMVAWQSPE